MALDIAPDDKGNLLILGARKDRLFNVYDKEGKYLYSFGNLFNIPEEFSKFKEAGLFRAPLRLWTSKNRVFVMNPYEYEICLYEDESLKSRLTRKSPDYLKPEIK